MLINPFWAPIIGICVDIAPTAGKEGSGSSVGFNLIHLTFSTFQQKDKEVAEQQQGGKLVGLGQIFGSYICETCAGVLRTELHQNITLIMLPWDLGEGTLVLGQY